LNPDCADSGGGTEFRWALADHQGSVRDLASNAGAVLKHREFDSSYYGARRPI